MQSEGNGIASPHPRARRQQNNKNNRSQLQPNEALSDSNVPISHTPKGKKQQRSGQQGERSNSAAVHSNQHANNAQHQRSRPVSMATANGNLTATPSKPSYAGAAFHASPAPSSLPVPKFFSKSVPGPNANSGFQARVDREGDRSDSNEPGPNSSLSPALARSSVKSPLDMFFDADRQEKARTRSGGGLPQSHLSPQSRSETPSKSKDMFMLELDGTSSPATSQTATPSTTRAQAFSKRSVTAPDNVPTVQQSEEERRAQQTQSLKSFLNLTAAQSPSYSPFLATPQNNGFASPSRTPQQDPNLRYGNRNLSPLFQAARSPQAHPSPEQAPFYHNPTHGHPNHYNNNSNYSDHFASPSKSPNPTPVHNYTMYQPNFAASGPSQSPSGRPYDGPTQVPNTASPAKANDDVRAMEDKMRKMLKLG